MLHTRMYKITVTSHLSTCHIRAGCDDFSASCMCKIAKLLSFYHRLLSCSQILIQLLRGKNSLKNRLKNRWYAVMC